jgi:crotonobetainyl-CoA:carnitine CoA-transferase CaiB-like acyl-CoA transferase
MQRESSKERGSSAPASSLNDMQVLDFSTGIAGGYCSKLLADGGADVIRVVPADGVRSGGESASCAGGRENDDPLFRFLHVSKRSMAAAFGDEAVASLLPGTQMVIESGEITESDIVRLRQEYPRIVVVSISPFGRGVPEEDVPWSEFTLQALAGSTASRGTLESGPLQTGGRLGEWIGGLYAAGAGLAAHRASRLLGRGDRVDVSILECMCITMGGYYKTLHKAMGGVRALEIARSIEVPSVEETKDGMVGFCTITRQQVNDFFVMIERPELADDEDLLSAVGRQRRREEFSGIISEWTTQHSTEEIIELASLLRIPVSAIGRPSEIAALDHFAERGVFVPHPDGDFVQPRIPYLINESASAPALPSSARTDGGPLSATPVQWKDAEVAQGSPDGEVSGFDWLSGLKIVDLTTFWAGPTATQFYAACGADVVKVESIQRPDGSRLSSTQSPALPQWWEWSPLFQSVNAGKRAITLNLSTEEGKRLLGRLIETADLVVENYSPRVLDNFGITWEWIRSINPRTILVRMPAFGLTGPWRNRTGFAQTVEQASGMAWMTGLGEALPIVPRGVCDPVAGMHAAFAGLLAVERLERSGEGCLVEVPMVETALNIAAEPLLEYSASGLELRRNGNRSPSVAPQGVYRCQGEEQWLALTVENDTQWRALRRELGSPDWMGDESFDHLEGRAAAADLMDRRLGEWAQAMELSAAVQRLSRAGVPAAPVVDQLDALGHPALVSRRFVERVDHPLLGPLEIVGLPFRAESHPAPWIDRPAPLLGQHNEEVLQDYLGVSDQELGRLDSSSVIGKSLT